MPPCGRTDAAAKGVRGPARAVKARGIIHEPKGQLSDDDRRLGGAPTVKVVVDDLVEAAARRAAAPTPQIGEGGGNFKKNPDLQLNLN